MTRAWSCSTSRALVAVRRVSTPRRTAKCGARSFACSVTSGHDRLIIAGSSKEPPVERPGVFASEDTIGPHGNEKNLSAILSL